MPTPLELEIDAIDSPRQYLPEQIRKTPEAKIKPVLTPFFRATRSISGRALVQTGSSFEPGQVVFEIVAWDKPSVENFVKGLALDSGQIVTYSQTEEQSFLIHAATELGAVRLALSRALASLNKKLSAFNDFSTNIVPHAYTQADIDKWQQTSFLYNYTP